MCNVHRKALEKSHVILDGKQENESVGDALHELSRTKDINTNSCPLSQWCHPTISSSITSFSSCLQSFPASGRVFSSESALHIRWPNYWSFSISPSKEYSGLISFKISLVGRKMFSASSSSQEETWWSYLLGRGAPKVMFTFINLLLFCVGSKKLENFFEFF